ncbi:unnamed protein product [Arabidopsis halleri]
MQVMVAKFNQLSQNGQDNTSCLMCLSEEEFTSVAAMVRRSYQFLS